MGEDPPAFESSETMIAEWMELAELNGISANLEGKTDLRLIEILKEDMGFTTKVLYAAMSVMDTPLLKRLAAVVPLALGMSQPSTPVQETIPDDEMEEVAAPTQVPADDENENVPILDADTPGPPNEAGPGKRTCRLSCKTNRHPYTRRTRWGSG